MHGRTVLGVRAGIRALLVRCKFLSTGVIASVYGPVCGCIGQVMGRCASVIRPVYGAVFGPNCHGIRAGVRTLVAWCTGRCAGVLCSVYGVLFGLYWPGVRGGVQAKFSGVMAGVWA